MAENNDKLKDFPLLNDPRAFSEQERNMIMKRIDKGDVEAASNAYNKKMGKIGVEAASKVAELGMYASGIGDAALIAKGGVTLAKSAPEIIKSVPKILETGAEVVKSAGAGITKAIEGGGELAASLGKSASKGVDYVTETGKSLFSKLKSRPKTAEEGIESTAKGALKNKAGEAVGEAEVSKTIGGKLAERAKSVLTKGKYVAEGYVLGEVIDKIGEYMNPKPQDDYDYGEDGGNVISSGGGSGNGGDVIPYSNDEMIDGSSLVPDTFVHTGEYLGKDSSVLGGNKAESILQQILEQLREIKSINISMLTSLNRLVSLQSKMNENMQIMFAQQENRENATIIPGSPTRNYTPSRKQESSSPSLLSVVGGSAVAAGSSLMNAFRNDREDDETVSKNSAILGSGNGKSSSPYVSYNLGNLSNDKTKTAMQILVSRGWSKEQAAGITTNLMGESGLNEKAEGDLDKTSGTYTAYGIAQWHPDRQQLFKLVTGKDIRGSTFEEQVSFVDWELKNREKAAGDKIKAAKTSKEAAALVEQKYERSALGQMGGVHPERLKWAEKFESMELDKTTSTLSGGPTKENVEKLGLPTSTKIPTDNTKVVNADQSNIIKSDTSTEKQSNFFTDIFDSQSSDSKKESSEKVVITKDTGFVLQPVKESLAERISQDTSMKSDLTPKTQVLQHSDDIKITAQNKQNAELMKVAMASNKSTQVIQQPIPMGEQRSTQPNIPNPRNITNGPLLDVLISQFV